MVVKRKLVLNDTTTVYITKAMEPYILTLPANTSIILACDKLGSEEGIDKCVVLAGDVQNRLASDIAAQISQYADKLVNQLRIDKKEARGDYS